MLFSENDSAIQSSYLALQKALPQYFPPRKFLNSGSPRAKSPRSGLPSGATAGTVLGRADRVVDSLVCLYFGLPGSYSCHLRSSDRDPHANLESNPAHPEAPIRAAPRHFQHTIAILTNCCVLEGMPCFCSGWPSNIGNIKLNSKSATSQPSTRCSPIIFLRATFPFTTGGLDIIFIG